MKASGDTYTASLPTDKVGDMFYYISVKTDKETITKPTNSAEPIVLNIDDGKVKGDPDQITITPVPEQPGDRLPERTDPRVTKTVIQYKVKGASKWETKSGTSYVESVTAGYKEKAAHRVEITGLTPSAEYVYRVGDGGEVMSEEAHRLLSDAGLCVKYGTLVPEILNRAGTAPCPMEQAAAAVTDPAEALPVLRKAMQELQKQ